MIQGAKRPTPLRRRCALTRRLRAAQRSYAAGRAWRRNSHHPTPKEASASRGVSLDVLCLRDPPCHFVEARTPTKSIGPPPHPPPEQLPTLWISPNNRLSVTPPPPHPLRTAPNSGPTPPLSTPPPPSSLRHICRASVRPLPSPSMSRWALGCPGRAGARRRGKPGACP